MFENLFSDQQFADAETELDGAAAEASGILNDPGKVDQIIEEVQKRLGDFPGSMKDIVKDVPVLIRMIKGYITGTYKDISPKVIASMLGALLYLVKGKDIIPDYIPVLGLVDDAAVLAVAIRINRKELDAFQAWERGDVIDAGEAVVIEG